jgi:hypothetical protein
MKRGSYGELLRNYGTVLEHLVSEQMLQEVEDGTLVNSTDQWSFLSTSLRREGRIQVWSSLLEIIEGYAKKERGESI